MSSQHNPASAPQETGLWLVGARGAISTTLALGLGALQRQLAPATGILTATPAFADLDWVPFSGWVLGGHDVCLRDIRQSAKDLERAQIAPLGLPVALDEFLGEFDAAIRPGLLDGPGDVAGLDNIDPKSSELGQRSPREQIQQLQEDWREFEQAKGLATTVVVCVASTEAVQAPQAAWNNLADFEAALDRGDSQPASMLYAYAALESGRPFVNFTPNVGANCPALQDLALARGVVHCGNDGKTGETLLKTSLAPMFHARALNVMSWQGYNMLGNRDGQVLRQPGHREAKLANKDEALRSILQQEGASANPDLHSHVAIDYVPSLGDWKTAWDFVHFEGFLGARMSLQFTWAGSDSALAAPLLIDLVRLAERGQRRGEKGCMPHTACFFKAPLGGVTHDFHRQYHALLEYLGQVDPDQ